MNNVLMYMVNGCKLQCISKIEIYCAIKLMLDVPVFVSRVNILKPSVGVILYISSWLTVAGL